MDQLQLDFLQARQDAKKSLFYSTLWLLFLLVVTFFIRFDARPDQLVDTPPLRSDEVIEEFQIDNVALEDVAGGSRGGGTPGSGRIAPPAEQSERVATSSNGEFSHNSGNSNNNNSPNGTNNTSTTSQTTNLFGNGGSGGGNGSGNGPFGGPGNGNGDGDSDDDGDGKLTSKEIIVTTYNEATKEAIENLPLEADQTLIKIKQELDGTFTGTVITLYDSDGNGIPNYLDKNK
jgi:hypothetical protein